MGKERYYSLMQPSLSILDTHQMTHVVLENGKAAVKDFYAAMQTADTLVIRGYGQYEIPVTFIRYASDITISECSFGLNELSEMVFLNRKRTKPLTLRIVDCKFENETLDLSVLSFMADSLVSLTIMDCSKNTTFDVLFGRIEYMERLKELVIRSDGVNENESMRKLVGSLSRSNLKRLDLRGNDVRELKALKRAAKEKRVELLV